MQQKSEYLNVWAGLAPGALLAFTLARLKNSYKWRLCSKIVIPATYMFSESRGHKYVCRIFPKEFENVSVFFELVIQ